MLNNTKID